MRASALFLSVLVCSALPLACAQIVGADFADAHPPEVDEPTSGIGGAAGVGGAAGSAGSVTAGSGGAAGTGANAVPTTCSGADYNVGCCAADGNAYFCSSGMFGMTACAAGTCGFDTTTGQYECNTNGAADPSGLRPAACGADAAGAQSACTDFETFTREMSGQCQQCLSQLCANEISALSPCAAGEMACQTTCGTDTSCYCSCALMQPGTCGPAEAAANRCIDIECRTDCK